MEQEAVREAMRCLSALGEMQRWVGCLFIQTQAGGRDSSVLLLALGAV